MPLLSQRSMNIIQCLPGDNRFACISKCCSIAFIRQLSITIATIQLISQQKHTDNNIQSNYRNVLLRACLVPEMKINFSHTGSVKATVFACARKATTKLPSFVTPFMINVTFCNTYAILFDFKTRSRRRVIRPVCILFSERKFFLCCCCSFKWIKYEVTYIYSTILKYAVSLALPPFSFSTSYFVLLLTQKDEET